PLPVRFADQCLPVPYRMLAEAPLQMIEQRLYAVLDQVVGDALAAAGMDETGRAGMALLMGSSSADISVAEASFARELSQGNAALALERSSSLGNLANHVR